MGRQAVAGTLAVLLRDLLTQNHALRGESNELGPGAAAAVRESQPAGPRASACLPGGFYLPKRLMVTPSDFPSFDPNSLLHTVLRGQILQGHPKGGILISCRTGMAEEWVVPYMERESPILAHFMGFVDALK